MVWADDASSITCLAVPTSRNLAVASPSVNKIGCLGYANVRQKRLLSLGTSVFLPVWESTLLSAQKFTGSRKPFILPAIDTGNSSVRDSSNRLPAGSRPFCPFGTLYLQTCSGPNREKIFS